METVIQLIALLECYFVLHKIPSFHLCACKSIGKSMMSIGTIDDYKILFDLFSILFIKKELVLVARFFYFQKC